MFIKISILFRFSRVINLHGNKRNIIMIINNRRFISTGAVLNRRKFQYRHNIRSLTNVLASIACYLFNTRNNQHTGRTRIITNNIRPINRPTRRANRINTLHTIRDIRFIRSRMFRHIQVITIPGPKIFKTRRRMIRRLMINRRSIQQIFRRLVITNRSINNNRNIIILITTTLTRLSRVRTHNRIITRFQAIISRFYRSLHLINNRNIRQVSRSNFSTLRSRPTLPVAMIRS